MLPGCLPHPQTPPRCCGMGWGLGPCPARCLQSLFLFSSPGRAEKCPICDRGSTGGCSRPPSRAARLSGLCHVWAKNIHSSHGGKAKELVTANKTCVVLHGMHRHHFCTRTPSAHGSEPPTHAAAPKIPWKTTPDSGTPCSRRAGEAVNIHVVPKSHELSPPTLL